MANFSISTFKPEFLPSFVELNREWIERYFVLEATDILQLENPYDSILNVGGEIFFISDEEKVVATCAMVPHGENSYELAKMAVSPQARGQGHGDTLMRTALHWAKERGAHEVTLLSNTVLETAISLYKKHGFATTHLGKHPLYERCNIVMKINLETVGELKANRE